MAARGHKPKTALTPEEKLKCAYFHIVRGVEQHILADMYGVNHGRVNDAIMAVRRAVGIKTPGNETTGADQDSEPDD